MLASNATRPPASIDELISPALSAKLDRLDVASRKVFTGKLQGERHSKRRGQSVEFDDYRTYTPGDDLRHIDWNVFARLDRYFVKLFLEEEDLALHLIIDASASMDAGEPNKLVFAQKLAMAMGYLGLVHNNRVAVTVFGGRRVHRLPESRGRRSIRRLGAFLLDSAFDRPADDEAEARLTARADGARPPAPGAGFTDALRTAAATATGAGVVILLSDFLEPAGYDEGLKYLTGRRTWDVCCLQILSPGELDPATEAAVTGANTDADARRKRSTAGVLGDLRLTDAETGRNAEVTITPALLDRYRDSVRRYCDDLKQFCRRRDMSYLLVPSSTPVEQLVVDRLRRLGVVR